MIQHPVLATVPRVATYLQHGLMGLRTWLDKQQVTTGRFQMTERTHNCMVTADRAVSVILKEFQWDQRPRPLQNGLIHH